MLFILLGICLLYSLTLTSFLYLIATIYFIIAAIIVLVVEPYKEEYVIYNIQDCVLFLWLALASALICFVNFAGIFQRKYLITALLSMLPAAVVPVMLIAIVIIYRMWKRSGWKLCKRCPTDPDLDASLAHRIINSSEYKDTCGYVSLKTTCTEVVTKPPTL